MRGTDRGQGFTLEGVFSSLLLVTALLFAIQVVSPATYASDTAGESAGLQQQADDLLAAAEDDGTLSQVVLCGGKNVSDGPEPHASPYRAIANGVIDDSLNPNLQHNATEFGYMLNRTFSARGYQYSVEFAYVNASTGERTFEQVYPGEGPGAPRDAVVATRTVTLYDGMTTTGINDSEPGHPDKYCDAGSHGVSLEAVSGPDEFYAKDIAPDRELYNIVEVRVMVW